MHRVKNDLRYGITPAWAGKSTVVLPTPGYLWDHPRVGGEKLVFHVGQRGQRGSPPRGRGKVFDPYFLEYGSKDHPRVGGEKLLQFALPLLLTGSPPRGRGKGNQAFSWYGSSRITPAWAGKRFWNRPWVWATSDHPRMGGEKSFDQACTGVVEGSPPHGRGKDVRQVGAVCGRGITPAWAGKSLVRGCAALRLRDHPRMGGEKRLRAWPSALHTGSPPHGRGKDIVYRHGLSRGGITPAWAGKSPASQPWSPPLWMMVIRPRP